MKTIKYVAILLFSLSMAQENFAQINVHVGVGRPINYHPPVRIITPYRQPRTVVVARPPYNRNNYYHASPYRGSSYYKKPVVVNRYYYGGGYHPRPSYYRPFSRPSFGVRINILPRGYYPFSMGNSRYYYNDGLYYQPYQGYYQTIAPPLGATVPSLPRGASSVFINNQTYYEYNGTYYLRSYNGTGKFEVVGVNGVLQTDMQEEYAEDGITNSQSSFTLPENFKTVVLNNKVYYVTPTGEYYTKNIDEKGNITYRVETK